MIKAGETIDICLVTYNRLAYLQNCVWSIIASTIIPHRILVLSDASTDGTNEWLLEMQKHKKIDKVVINKSNLGSPQSFNRIIKESSSKYFVMACDDIWFHRGWDTASIKVLNEFQDCGMVTFFNWPVIDQSARVNNTAHKIQLTGLAGTLMSREIFDAVGGFSLPANMKMGLFAKELCKNALKCNFTRKYQYVTIPEYAVQMDRNNPSDPPDKDPPKLHQEYLFVEYNQMRAKEKQAFYALGAAKRQKIQQTKKHK